MPQNNQENRLRHRAKLALLCLPMVSIPSIGHADGAKLPPIDGPAYTQPQRMVEIEPGRRLNLYCIGAGSPTVVFESGGGDPLAVWGYVQPEVAKTVRACSYDRAGIGFSDGANRPSTAANMADDLHRLLVAAGIKPPYVLVGHSLGGMAVRLYADRYRAEVVGMVQVDPAVEDQLESFRKLDPQHRTAEQWRAYSVEPELKDARACVEAAKAGVGLVRGSEMFKKCTPEPYLFYSDAVNIAWEDNAAKLADRLADLSETENAFYASGDEVRASRHSYGDMPLAVLTKGMFSKVKPDATPEDIAYHEAIIATWTRLHDDVAKLSTRGTNVVVPGARHHIMLDQPQAVTDTIDRIVAEARGK